jgi:glutamate-1-semialdehyde 2,1-aminomutase
MDMQAKALAEAGIGAQVCGDQTLFDLYFTDRPPVDYRSARHRDPQMNVVWNRHLRAEGVFKSPGKLYPSLAVGAAELDKTQIAVSRAASALRAYLDAKS